MRKTVHLCLSSHKEIMYRDEEDLIMGFNCLAFAVLETETRLLGEGFMTTHNHKLVQTDNVVALSQKDRYAYSRFFNAKYSRSGRLGEKYVFEVEVTGIHHTTVALNYVLRQGLHHGLAATPFGYPHCSVSSFFRKDLGKVLAPELIADANRYKYTPNRKALPSCYRMARSGLILREDIVDTAYVEELYVTPRNFLFQMNRITDEKIVQEQKEENSRPPVTIETIERGVSVFNIKDALLGELGRVDRSVLGDLDLCRIIDTVYLKRFLKENEKQSIYCLSPEKRAELGNMLWRDIEQRRLHSIMPSEMRSLVSGRKASVAQIRRCLAL